MQKKNFKISILLNKLSLIHWPEQTKISYFMAYLGHEEIGPNYVHLLHITQLPKCNNAETPMLQPVQQAGSLAYLLGALRLPYF